MRQVRRATSPHPASKNTVLGLLYTDGPERYARRRGVARQNPPASTACRNNSSSSTSP